MSTTVVQIRHAGTSRSPEPFQVLIVEGDTIEFSTEPGGGSILSLTSETAAILSPSPASLVVDIAAGTSVSFAFLNPASRSYACQVLAEGDEPRPIATPPAQDAAILTILSSDARGTDTRTGRGL